MNNPRIHRIACLAATTLAAALLLFSLRLPLWHLKMEAPQYQDEEALRVRVYPSALAGDLREIKVLNQYIGVHIPDKLPQLHWLPIALVAAAGLGLAVNLLPSASRSRGLLATAILLCFILLASAVLAQKQMHQIGHNRDRHTILKGVPDFTPPLLGSVKVANFEISTGLGIGALVIAAGVALQFAGGFLARGEAATRSSSPKPATVSGDGHPITVPAL